MGKSFVALSDYILKHHYQSWGRSRGIMGGGGPRWIQSEIGHKVLAHPKSLIVFGPGPLAGTKQADIHNLPYRHTFAYVCNTHFRH